MTDRKACLPIHSLKLLVRAAPVACKNENVIFATYLVAAIVACILAYLKHGSFVLGVPFKDYNAFLIFKQAFFHLINQQDLYILYPQEHWDLYKYSPTFALFMGLFAYLPNLGGLILWDCLNALSVYWAIRSMPGLSPTLRVGMLWFVLVALLYSIQYSQVNGLMDALIIFSFNALERGTIVLATFFLVASVYIKLFSLMAVLLYFFYPHRLRTLVFSILWGLGFLIVPLVVIHLYQLLFLYGSWWHLLLTDYSSSLGLSVMGWLQGWFHLNMSKTLIVLMGAIVLCLPLINKQYWGERAFRLLFLGNLLIWVTIFNHRGEPQTFIVAICGVAIWYFCQTATLINSLLACLAFVFTSLSRTDIFPEYLKVHLIYPYGLEVVPCIMIWGKATYDLLFHAYTSRVTLQQHV